MTTDLIKSGKTTFKSLDSTIITEDKNGKKEESGRRVDEVNQEMTAAMGVSKAILNNVIFCHQEDSNWPLEEGKKLKEKFDAIFGTTEYDKAIKKFINYRKDAQAKHKNCQTDIGYKEGYKRDAEKKKLDLDKQVEKRANMEIEIKDLEVSLDAVQKENQQLLKVEQKYGELHGKKVIFEATIQNCSKNEETKRSNLKTLLDCDTTELENQIKSFKDTQKKNEAELQILNEKRERFVTEEKDLYSKNIRAQAELANYSESLGQLQDLQSKRDEDIKLLAEQLDLPLAANVDSQLMSPDDLTTSINRIEQGIAGREEALSEYKRDKDAKDVDYQKQIDKTRDEKTSIDTNLKVQRQRIHTISDEQRGKRKDIQAIEMSVPMLNKLIKEITTAEQELDNFKAGINVEELEDERTLAELEKNELESKLEGLEKDIEVLDSISKVSNDRDTKRAELAQNESDFERTKNKHLSTLKHLFPSKTVDRNYKNAVQARDQELKSEIESITSATNEARMKKTRLQTQRAHLIEEQKKKQKELAEINEKIDGMCDGRNYLDLLASQKEKVEKLTMDLAYHQSSEAMFKHYKEDIDQRPFCPLCHKNLDANEGDDLKGLLIASCPS